MLKILIRIAVQDANHPVKFSSQLQKISCMYGLFELTLIMCQYPLGHYLHGCRKTRQVYV